MSKIQLPFNYYGSKDKLCPRIHELIPSGITTWVDLFCGSGIVTLKKPRHKREVINDLNRDIVDLFYVLRDEDQKQELLRQLFNTPYAEEMLRDAYRVKGATRVEKAYWFLIKQWFGRGGDEHKTGFRWSKNQTTSPERTWFNICERLEATADRLRGVCIRNDDVLKIIGDYDDAACCLFVDPPYPGPVGRRYLHKMQEDHHHVLIEALKATRAKVILTMSPETIYSELLSDWVETSVSVVGSGNRKKPEVILTNYEPLPLLVGAAE